MAREKKQNKKQAGRRGRQEDESNSEIRTHNMTRCNAKLTQKVLEEGLNKGFLQCAKEHDIKRERQRVSQGWWWGGGC